MSTTVKRPLDLGSVSVGSAESTTSTNSGDSNELAALGDEEPRKKGSKPGRKPLDDEAKNKRTAQNRAAQRAFRERKERKMKELEDKVHDLEQMNQQSAVESEFLRSQLMTLINELKKYRPANANDSQVLAYLSKNDTASGSSGAEDSMKKKMDFTFAFPWKNKNNSGEQFPSPGSSSSNSVPSTKKNMSGPSPGTVDSVSDQNNNTPNSTSTTSGWMDNVFYSDDAQKLPQFPGTSSISDPLAQDSVLFSNHFNFDEEFDEQVSEFCSKMNEACGTKECPIPKQTPKQTPKPTPTDLTNTWDSRGAVKSPNVELDGEMDAESNNNKNSVPSSSTSITSSCFSNEKNNNVLNSNSVNDFIIEDSVDTQQLKNTEKIDAMPFLDTSLAFPTENDQSLIFRDNQDSNLFAEFLDEKDTNDANNDFEDNLINEEPLFAGGAVAIGEDANNIDDSSSIVPARDGKLLKCSEIWDRITSHPKYTSIDIDGLCVELMAKAKCSEKGVVLQAEHVQRALEKQASLTQD